MQRGRLYILAVALICAIAACATLTPEQKTLWALNVYQAQYELYLDQVLDPSLTEDKKAAIKADLSLVTPEMINQNISESQRDALRVKKQILIELKPLVLMVAEYTKTGTLPPDDVQRKLTELINRLVGALED